MLCKINSTFCSFIKTSTTPPTTKLVRIEEASIEEHIEKSNKNLSDLAAEANQSDFNDTMEIVMTDDVNANATEIAELSERKSKVLSGFSEEAKILNNISSRSTLQIASSSSAAGGEDRLSSSEALFDSDTDNGGITMNAGIISIICVGIIGSLSAFSIMFVYIYRRRFLNNPQALSEPDSSGYIEDSIRVTNKYIYLFNNFPSINQFSSLHSSRIILTNYIVLTTIHFSIHLKQ